MGLGMNIFIISVVLLILRGVNARELCPVNFCNGTQPSHTEVKDYCNKTGESFIERCCIANETIIGLDLTSCQIKKLNISEGNFTDTVIIDLRDNELENVVPTDLIGLLNLDYLYLPKSMPCPGGDQAWNKTVSNETLCFLQKNPCEYLNISCTQNGQCEHLGPGSAKCICIPGHYGYKCLNKGEFPSTVFGISVAVSTVILSIVLWFAHGRDAYRKR